MARDRDGIYTRKDRPGQFWGSWIDASGKRRQRKLNAFTLTQARTLLNAEKVYAERAKSLGVAPPPNESPTTCSDVFSRHMSGTIAPRVCIAQIASIFGRSQRTIYRWFKNNSDAGPICDANGLYAWSDVVKWLEAHEAKHRPRTAARLLADERRRDAMYGMTVDRVSIFERDGWICMICRKPVDKTLAFPHRYSPSLDHIEPIARGGKHVADNCQLAHLICNIRKGAS